MGFHLLPNALAIACTQQVRAWLADWLTGLDGHFFLLRIGCS
jgi:hypothetical protein